LPQSGERFSLRLVYYQIRKVNTSGDAVSSSFTSFLEKHMINTSAGTLYTSFKLQGSHPIVDVVPIFPIFKSFRFNVSPQLFGIMPSFVQRLISSLKLSVRADGEFFIRSETERRMLTNAKDTFRVDTSSDIESLNYRISSIDNFSQYLIIFIAFKF
jgi:hypothetical protein